MQPLDGSAPPAGTPATGGRPCLPADTPLDQLLNRPDFDHLLETGLWVTEEGTAIGQLTAATLVQALARQARTAAGERDTARRVLARMQQERAMLSANLSHELRTPLNAIVGYSDLIRSAVLGRIEPPLYGDYVDAIHDSGLHLVSLLDAILDLSKIQANEMQLQEGPVSVVMAMHVVTRILRAIARNRDVRLECRVPSDLPLLNADERIVRQLLLNLVGNAIKFTRPGTEVTLSARITSRGAMRIEVRDRGPGIAPEQIAVVLQPFKQLTDGPAGSAGGGLRGTGLGLPLVKALTELHDGQFRLISRPGRGTRAVITMPSARVLGAKPHDAQGEFRFTRATQDLYL